MMCYDVRLVDEQAKISNARKPKMGSENHPVREVLQKVVQDAAINADQVKELESFVNADWVIDEDEAKFLFRVNKALGDSKQVCPEWTQFFVMSISRFVVMDLNTPGEIDEAEGDWLADMMNEFSIDNESEQKLIFELQKTTSSIGGKLGKWIQSFE
jgi:hypothetical protein